MKAREELFKNRQERSEKRREALSRVDQIALFSCCHSGHLAPLEQLFKAGLVGQGLGDATPIVDLGKDRLVNGLHVACVAGHRQVALELVGRGFDVDRRSTPDGRTGLFFAVERGHAELAAALLRVGAAVNLHLECFLSEDEDGLEALEDGDIEVLEAFSGCTPLHIASRLGRLDLVNLLLSHGAKVDAVNEMRMTALHLAGSGEVAEALCVAGADPTGPPDDNGERPIDSARRRGNEEVARVLSSRGADEWVSAAPGPEETLSGADLVVKFWFSPRERCPSCRSSKLAEEVSLAQARGPHGHGVHSYRCRRCAWVGKYAFDERMVPRYFDTARWVPPAWRRRYACKGGATEGDDQVVPHVQKRRKKRPAVPEAGAGGPHADHAVEAGDAGGAAGGEEEAEEAEEARRVERLLSTAGPASSTEDDDSGDEAPRQRGGGGGGRRASEGPRKDGDGLGDDGEDGADEESEFVDWPYDESFKMPNPTHQPIRNSTLATIREDSSASTVTIDPDNRLRTTWGKLVSKEGSVISSESSEDNMASPKPIGRKKGAMLKPSPQIERVSLRLPPISLSITGLVAADFRSPPSSAFVTVSVHRKESYRVFTSEKFLGQSFITVPLPPLLLDRGKLCTLEIWDEMGDSEDQLLASLKVFPENIVHGSAFQFKSLDGSEGPEMMVELLQTYC